MTTAFDFFDSRYGTANFHEEERFTRRFGDLVVYVFLEKVVPSLSPDEWYHSVRITYNTGYGSGSYSGIRIDPENEKTKHLYKTICDEIKALEGRDEDNITWIVRGMADSYHKMVRNERRKKLEGEGQLVKEEVTKLNGFKITVQEIERDGERIVELSYQREENGCASLLAAWTEEDNQRDYYDTFEKVVQEIKNYKFEIGDLEETLYFLHRLESFIESEREEAYEKHMSERASKAIQDLLQKRILLTSIQEISRTARDLYHEDYEIYSHKLYIAINDLMNEGRFMSQSINDQITAIAEERGITLTEQQLDTAIAGVEYWISEGIRDSIDATLGMIMYDEKSKAETAYKELVERTVEFHRDESVTLDHAIELALGQSFGSGFGFQIVDAAGKNTHMFKQDIIINQAKQ